MSTDTQDGVPSRREFLKGVGAAGAGLVAGSVGGGTALAATSAAPPAAPNAPGAHFAHGGVPTSSLDFGRMFPDLPPFAEANDTVRAALLEVGMPGGHHGRRGPVLGGAEGADRRSHRQRQPDRH